jgi:anaerobic selenocysteine-containing dehydrogenase
MHAPTRSAAIAIHYRACPLCEAICGLELRYDGDTLAAIRGDRDDPFSRGHVCPKGNAIIDLEADPDRLRQPVRRIDGEFVPIGWDEAFAFAGQRIAEIQQAHGADAVAVYLGNPNAHHYGHTAYLPALLRAIRSRNVFSASSVDQWPHQLVSRLMYGHQFLIPLPDVDRTDYFLMLGANPVASNGSLMTAPGIDRRLKALVQRGTLVVIDPRRTETAAIASRHHAIRPGTDALFLVALLQAMMRIGAPKIDRYHGKLSNLDLALGAVAAVRTGDVAAVTGIAADVVDAIAAGLYAAPRAVVYGRMGMSTQAFGSLCQWLAQLANLYTGNLDAEGGSLPNQPVIPMTGPGTSRGHYGRWHSRVRGLAEFAGELPVAVLREEIETPGAGQVRALVTCAGNPVLSTPDGARLDRALGTLDFMLAIDIYINETTRHADLILPPASFLTQPQFDLIFNLFAVRKVAKLSPPVRAQSEDERADWQIVNGIGHAYGEAAGKAWTNLPEPRVTIADGLRRGGSGLTLADLDAAPHGLDLGPLTPSLLARLETESGMVECAPGLLLDDLERAAAHFASAGDSDALLLIGRRDARSNNSWMHNAPRLIKGKLRHQLLMHPDDLAARGLQDGAHVRIRSRTGSVATEVHADDSMMPGVVSLPHGFGHQREGVKLARASRVRGASINDLTDVQALDRPSGNAAFSGTPVWVEAAH